MASLLYKLQEQLSSTQQEEIFHKFQLQEQFTLFHSKLPQMLKMKKAGVRLVIIFSNGTYHGLESVFEINTVGPGNYLSESLYGLVTCKWHTVPPGSSFPFHNI
jgi:hypothetical protein